MVACAFLSMALRHGACYEPIDSGTVMFGVYRCFSSRICAWHRSCNISYTVLRKGWYEITISKCCFKTDIAMIHIKEKLVETQSSHSRSFVKYKQSWLWCANTEILLDCFKRCRQLNSSLPSASSYMRQWIGSALVQIMACRLLGAWTNFALLSTESLKKNQWNFNQNIKFFIHENAL